MTKTSGKTNASFHYSWDNLASHAMQRGLSVKGTRTDWGALSTDSTLASDPWAFGTRLEAR